MLRKILGTFCLRIRENIFQEWDNKCSQTEKKKVWEHKNVDGKIMAQILDLLWHINCPK